MKNFKDDHSFNLTNFLDNGKPNEEPMFFLRLPMKQIVSTYTGAVTDMGFFIVEWLERHNLTKFKFDTWQNNVYLVFETLTDRKQMELLFEDPIYVACKKFEHIYLDQRGLLEFINAADHGYYLSSGHKPKSSLDSGYESINEYKYDIFCWIRRNTKSPVFVYSDKFFFTNQNEELQFKIRWI